MAHFVPLAISNIFSCEYEYKIYSSPKESLLRPLGYSEDLYGADCVLLWGRWKVGVRLALLQEMKCLIG